MTLSGDFNIREMSQSGASLKSTKNSKTARITLNSSTIDPSSIEKPLVPNIKANKGIKEDKAMKLQVGKGKLTHTLSEEK